MRALAKVTLVAGGMLLLVALCTQSFRGSESSARPLDESRPQSSQVTPGDGAQTSLTQQDSRTQGVPEPTAEPVSPGPRAGVELRFRLKTDTGDWDSTGEGKVLAMWDPSVAGRAELVIKDGSAWLPETVASSGTSLSLQFLKLELHGRRAEPFEERTIVQCPGRVDVDCRYRVTMIRAFSGEDRVECTDLTLCASGGMNQELFVMPACNADGQPFGVLREHASSPLILDDKEGTKVYFLRAPDTAWKRIGVDHNSPGTYRVLLKPGGDASFQLAPLGTPHQSVMRLRLYSASKETFASEARGDLLLSPEGRSTATGLPSGSWLVRPEYGRLGELKLVFGEAAFEVRTGEQTSVSVEVHQMPPQESAAHVHGVLHFQPGVVLPHGELTLRSKDPWSPRSLRPPVFALSSLARAPGLEHSLLWDAGSVPPGDYVLELCSLQAAKDVRVEPSTEQRVDVDLRGLENVSVRAIDSRTRAPIALRRLGCRALDGDARLAGLFYSVDVASAQALDPIQLCLRPGRYRLSFESPDFPSTGRDVVFQSGGEPLVFEVESQRLPTSQVSVTLRCEGVLYPADPAWWHALTVGDSLGERVTPSLGTRSSGFSNLGSGGDLRFVDMEGPVRIVFPPLDDFEPIPPAEVTLSASRKAEVRIDLVSSF
ncbi:MAG TPA: hypothetical protein VK843_21105 [Planctomycetota bacterium]|nr:hypothetical protein [Planctomycetota bacterium]